MALTRKFLEAMSLSAEQVQAIIDEHTNVTDALKAQRDKFEQDALRYKAEADKLPELQNKLKGFEGKEDFEEKYNQEHQAFEDYKAQRIKDEETAKIKDAYRQLLLDESINEKRIDAVMRLTDFSTMKLDKDGKLEKLDDLKKNIGEEWSDYKVTQRERRPQIATPPINSGVIGHGTGRAAELAAKYNQERYGVKPDTGKE